MKKKKTLCAIPIALIAMLAVPSFASADATVSRSGTGSNLVINIQASGSPARVDVESVQYVNGVVRITGGDDQNNELVDGGQNCSEANGDVVECEVSGNINNLARIDVTLGNGGENLFIAAGFPRPINVLAGYSGIAHVISGDGADTINGGAGQDDIEGRGGNDVINGNGDNDHIAGNDGQDTLNGNAGDDMVGAENEGDQDVVNCGGPGDNDIMGIDLNSAGNSVETSITGCERHLPHTTNVAGTLGVAPVAGTTYSAASLTIPRFSNPATTPDVHRYRWYRCTSAVLPRANQVNSPLADWSAPGGLSGIADGCTAINNTPSETVNVEPAWAGQYLGAVGQSGLITDAGYLDRIFATESFASVTARLIESAPVNAGGISAPTISGTAAVGADLTANNGTWTGAPAPGFTYQWQRCDDAGAACVNISGETAATYTVTAADIDSTVRVVVTGTNTAGSATANSAVTAEIPAGTPLNTALPTISGNAAVGSTLTASGGTWTSNGQTTYTMRWQRCAADGPTCVDIAGAVGNSYTVTAADIGSRIRAVETADNPSPVNVDANSAFSAVVPTPATGGGSTGGGSSVGGAGTVAFTASNKVTCKKGKCTIKVTQSIAGKVTIKGSKVKPVTKTVGAGTTTITVKLTSKAKKSLKKKGKLSASVKVTSTSNSGVAKTASVKLSFKK